MSRSRPPPRVFLPDEPPVHGVCDLPPEQSHHLAHVLRAVVGDAVTVFDGEGQEYNAEITRIGKRAVTVRLGEGSVVDRESPLKVVLAQGISSGERMDYTIQKAVELGIGGIQPLITERSIVRLDASRAAKRVAHWQGVVVAACEQCGRNVVPPVEDVVTLTAWLGGLPALSRRFLLTPEGTTRLGELPRPAETVILLAGPEGGLSRRERENAGLAGFEPLRLGPRILRTETAALAALASMQAMWGDF